MHDVVKWLKEDRWFGIFWYVLANLMDYKEYSKENVKGLKNYFVYQSYFQKMMDLSKTKNLLSHSRYFQSALYLFQQAMGDEKVSQIEFVRCGGIDLLIETTRKLLVVMKTCPATDTFDEYYIDIFTLITAIWKILIINGAAKSTQDHLEPLRDQLVEILGLSILCWRISCTALSLLLDLTMIKTLFPPVSGEPDSQMVSPLNTKTSPFYREIGNLLIRYWHMIYERAIKTNTSGINLIEDITQNINGPSEEITLMVGVNLMIQLTQACYVYICQSEQVLVLKSMLLLLMEDQIELSDHMKLELCIEIYTNWQKNGVAEKITISSTTYLKMLQKVFATQCEEVKYVMYKLTQDCFTTKADINNSDEEKRSKKLKITNSPLNLGKSSPYPNIWSAIETTVREIKSAIRPTPKSSL